MGATNVLYDYGFEYQNPKKPYDMQGFVNSAGAVKGLELYKELYKCCTPPGASNVYMGESIDAFKSGQVALHMNFAFTWPGLYKDENVGGDKIGFFPNPAGPAGHFAQLGGQGISVLANTDNMDGALSYIKWFVRPKCRPSGGSSAASPAPRRCSSDPAFLASCALRQDVPRTRWPSSRTSGPSRPTPSFSRPCRSACTTMSSPTRARRRKRSICWSKDWTEVFQDEGKM